VAYGRITWKVRLYLDMENPMSPHSESWVDAPDGFPLDPAGDTKSVTEIQHNVTSPNAERVRNGIPVPAEVRDFDGTTRMEEIIYPKDVVDTEADITLREVPPEER